MTFCKEQKHRDRRKISGCRGCRLALGGGEGRVGGRPRGFRALENWDGCWACVPTHRVYSSEQTLTNTADLGWFESISVDAAYVRVSPSGGGCGWWRTVVTGVGQHVYGRSLPSSQSCCGPKSTFFKAWKYYFITELKLFLVCFTYTRLITGHPSKHSWLRRGCWASDVFLLGCYNQRGTSLALCSEEHLWKPLLESADSLFSLQLGSIPLSSPQDFEHKGFALLKLPFVMRWNWKYVLGCVYPDPALRAILEFPRAGVEYHLYSNILWKKYWMSYFLVRRWDFVIL